MSDNVVETLNQIQAAFTELKSTNEANLTQRDVVLEEKLGRINDVMSGLEGRLADIQKKASRPTIETGDTDAEMKSFTDFARGKIGVDEYKAMSATGTNEGGVTIPKVIENQLRTLLVDISPIRSIASVKTTTSPNYAIPFATTGAASGWVSEKAARPETAAPTIVEVVVPIGEMYASPLATQTIIQDSMFDVASFLQSQGSAEFARAEGEAFVSGNGVGKPKGFLAYASDAADDSTRAFGTLQFVKSGAAATITADGLSNLVFSLKAGFRAGAKFVANKASLGIVRTLKDGAGRYVYSIDGDAMLPKVLGYGVVEAENMPNTAANAFPLAFGNWEAGYTIVDRTGVEVLVDPYSAKPYITFYMTQRVGGCVVDSQALKLLKIAA